MTKPLHLKYRPLDFDQVVGQNEVVTSLERVLEDGGLQSFLFTGPSGTGKTTLARILARKMGCDDHNLMEIDAATHTGIDAMREVAGSSIYEGFGSKVKVLLIDEAHRLSAQAWASLLKTIEEPPPHARWMFCTTDPAKIPQTIKTRCATYTLKAVNSSDMSDLLDHVVEQEQIEVSEAIIDLVAKEARGSPRQALVYLDMVKGTKSLKKASRILRSALGDDGVIGLCQLLASRSDLKWTEVMKYVNGMKDQNPESVRIVIMHYFSTVLANTKQDKKVVNILRIMDCFMDPYPSTDGIGPLMISLGRYLYGSQEEG